MDIRSITKGHPLLYYGQKNTSCRKFTMSGLFRSMTEAMVDFSYGETSTGGAMVTRSGVGAAGGAATAISHRSGASSTIRSAADRSATEMEESDHTFVINREAYFQTSESYSHHQQ